MNTILVIKEINSAETDISDMFEKKLLLSKEVRFTIGQICGTSRRFFNRLHGLDKSPKAEMLDCIW
jgi:hypothetical protein